MKRIGIARSLFLVLAYSESHSYGGNCARTSIHLENPDERANPHNPAEMVVPPENPSRFGQTCSCDAPFSGRSRPQMAVGSFLTQGYNTHYGCAPQAASAGEEVAAPFCSLLASIPLQKPSEKVLLFFLQKTTDRLYRCFTHATVYEAAGRHSSPHSTCAHLAVGRAPDRVCPTPPAQGVPHLSQPCAVRYVAAHRSGSADSIPAHAVGDLLRKRVIIETSYDHLKNIHQIEHSRHRCPSTSRSIWLLS